MVTESGEDPTDVQEGTGEAGIPEVGPKKSWSSALLLRPFL